MLTVCITKEQKRKYYEYELYILESLVKDDKTKYSEFDDNSYIGNKMRYVKNRLFELNNNN